MNENDDSESELSLDGIPENFGGSGSGPNSVNALPSIPGHSLSRMVGQGGMGAVYEAKWLANNGQTVAIKTIFVQRFQTVPAAVMKRFEREVELLRTISHPNVIPILDYGEYEQEFQRVPYFTMPMMSAGDLAESIEETPIENKEQLRSRVSQLCKLIEGLAEAHQMGVVHRDIKPRNIFESAEGDLLLGDFGLAKILEEDSELTSTIGHMGTTPYAPPEQLLSAKMADSRADLYSLGVILYQFACFGLRPFAPSNDEATVDSSSETDSIARWQRSTQRIPPVPSNRINHFSDPSFDFIVRKCLAYYPEHRYQSANDLMEDLRSWLRGDIVRGSFSERLREHVYLPIRKHIKIASMVVSAMVILISAGVAYKFSSLSDDVSELEEDVSKERRSKLDLERQIDAQSQQRGTELRKELETILPRLQGERLDFEIRRLLDPDAEFARRLSRAKEISKDLNMANSSRFKDRHADWVIRRTSVAPGLNEDYLNHLKDLCVVTERNIEIASESGNRDEQLTAALDILRSRRTLIGFVKYINENDLVKEVSEFCDTPQLLRECQDSLKSILDSSTASEFPEANRYAMLLLLECSLYKVGITPKEVVQLCSDNKEEFSAKRLLADNCRSLHPWYSAWYIFEVYYETSTRIERSIGERKQITDDWYDLMVGTPAQAKGQNIVYLRDLLVVRDRRADVIRDGGDLIDALNCYESDWRECESALRFYRHDKKAWGYAEQVISSMLILAKKQRNAENVRKFYSREQTLLREKLLAVSENSKRFPDDESISTNVDLAGSLDSAADFSAGEARQSLLIEAERRLNVVLKDEPNHVNALDLLDSVQSKLARD